MNLRKTVSIIIVLNLSYFFIEFFMANKIGSVSLFADSPGDFKSEESLKIAKPEQGI